MNGTEVNNIIPEFPRPITVDKIPPRGMDIDIKAKAEECAALAERMGLIAIAAFSAQIALRRVEGGPVIEVEGSLSAQVTQQCVVTLEPIPATVSEKFTALYAPPELVPSDPGTIEITDVLAEEPEPIVDGIIDIGELAAQHLALALDPYPRKAGVAIPPIAAAQNQNEKNNPFAKLKDLIKNDQE